MVALNGVSEALERRICATLVHLDAATFDRSSIVDMQNLTVALQTVKAMHEVMATPILDGNGQITAESGRVLIKYRSIAEA